MFATCAIRAQTPVHLYAVVQSCEIRWVVCRDYFNYSTENAVDSFVSSRTAL